MENIICDSDIEDLASYKKLVRIRSRLVWTLTSILLLVLVGNIYLMSLGGELGSQKLFDDNPITFALVYSLFVIFFASVCCVFYAWWANKYLDSVIEEIMQDVEKITENAA